MNLNGARLCVFDLDGTLVDAFEDITSSVNYSLGRLGLPQLSVDKVRRYVGNGGQQLMRKILDEFIKEKAFKESDPGMEQAFGFWKEYYLAHPADRSRLYPGVKKTLDFLKQKGIKKAIFTNKAHEVTLEVAKALDITRDFDYIMGESAETPRKPSPEGLFFLMQKFQVSPLETWMVGDGEADIKAGLKAGCHVCGVTYGLLKRNELHDLGAHFIIDKLEELIET